MTTEDMKLVKKSEAKRISHDHHHSDGRQNASSFRVSIVTADRVLYATRWNTITADIVLDDTGWSTPTTDKVPDTVVWSTTTADRVHYIQLRKYSHGQQSTFAIYENIVTADRIHNDEAWCTTTAARIPDAIEWNTITADIVLATMEEVR